MTARHRVIAYGSAAAFALIGLIVAAVTNGLVGEIVGWTMFTLGFGAIVLLVFYEIGLSEDREREREGR
jgi:hypothetical protein